MIKNLDDNTLQELAKFTSNYFSHNDITNRLNVCNITPNMDGSKKNRLYNSFIEEQKRNNSCYNIFIFLRNILDPKIWLDNKEGYEQLKSEINMVLQFSKLAIKEDGSIGELDTQIKTLKEASKMMESLKKGIEKRELHPEIYKYCKTEMLQKDYFHSVEESIKGLVKRIRDLSNIQDKMETNLIEFVFSFDYNNNKHPYIAINELNTTSKQNEQKGFTKILTGIISAFRNPIAHEPRIDWELSEQDALDMLSTISWVHRKLDKSTIVR